MVSGLADSGAFARLWTIRRATTGHSLRPGQGERILAVRGLVCGRRLSVAACHAYDTTHGERPAAGAAGHGAYLSKDTYTGYHIYVAGDMCLSSDRICDLLFSVAELEDSSGMARHGRRNNGQ